MSEETHCYGCGEDLAKDGPNGERVVRLAAFYRIDGVRWPVCAKCRYRKQSAEPAAPSAD